MKKKKYFDEPNFFNFKKEYKYLFFSLLAFSIGFLIIDKYSNYIPIHENTITDYIQGNDSPFFKNRYIFYDLTFSFLIFIIIFNLFDKIKSPFLKENIKIIWIIKNFFSLFIVLLYEKSSGLDQVIYYDIVSNQKVWAQHYGYIYNLINFKSATSNFLLPFKYINYLFYDNWFLIKIFLNLIFLSIVYISYKIYLKINKYNSALIFYSFSLFPSLFFFSSLITKDLFILFYTLIAFYFFQKLNFNFNFGNFKNILIILACFFLIFSIRSWMGFILLLSTILPLLMLYIFKNTAFINKYLLLSFYLFIFISLIFFFETNFWNNIENILIQSQFSRLHNWHAFDPNNYKVFGINKENIYQFLLFDFWKMMILTVFNPFLNYLDEIKFYPFIFENFLIIILIVYSIFNSEFKINKSISFIFFFAVTYSTLYAHAGGFLNAGTSVRYSLQVKYLIFIYLLSVNKNSITNFLKNFNNFKNFYRQYVPLMKK